MVLWSEGYKPSSKIKPSFYGEKAILARNYKGQKMKHKHAELIHAWAEGAEIQFKAEINEEWQDTPRPQWHYDFQYRIKPAPKPDIVKLCRAIVSANDGKFYAFSGDSVKPTLKLVFDGETGLPKSAEVIK